MSILLSKAITSGQGRFLSQNVTTGIRSLTNAEKGVKAHPLNSGLLLVVNTAHNIKVIGKSWADELKDGTISTVLITQKGL